MTPEQRAKSISDAQAVFDALDRYIANSSWISSNASVTLDGGGSTNSMTSNNRNSLNSFTYTERTAGVRVSVAPMSASLGAGETQQFTASATNPDGSTVAGATFTWTVQTGALGSVDATGLYRAPAAIPAAAYDTVTATLTGQNSWSSVTVQLHP